VPTALSGLALAIASLGLCWDSVVDLQGLGQKLGALVASCILLPILFKFIFNLQLLKQDLQHPISSSVIPTLAMAMMVISNTIALYNFQLGVTISCLAIGLHLYFFSYFIVYRSQHFNFQQILPSWFIPPIGLVLALITHPGGLPLMLIEPTLLLGLISYTLLLPIVLYRLRFSLPLMDNEKPLLIILATPASLLLLAYISVVEQPNIFMVYLFLLLAVVMTFYAYLSFKKVLFLPFTPAYSAFTFPLVVGAIALFKTNQYLMNEGVDVPWVYLIEPLAYIELIVASIMVAYVSLRYLLNYSPFKNYDL